MFRKSHSTSRRAIFSTLALGLALGAPAFAGKDWRGHGEHGRGHAHGHGKHHKHSKHRHYDGCGHAGYGYHPEHYGRAYAPTRFVRPVRIYAQAVPTYEPYYSGRAWFGPHRHYHEVYSFPVLTPAGYVYQPHAYCDGAFYDRRDRIGGFVSVDGDRFSVDVGF